MMELTVDALKLRFQRYEVPGLSKLVLLERRKKVVEMKWLSPQQAQHIHSIWSPLPYPCHSQEDESDEEQMFISQTRTSQDHSQRAASSQKRRSQNGGTPQYQRGDESPTPSAPVRSKFTNSIPMFSFNSETDDNV